MKLFAVHTSCRPPYLESKTGAKIASHQSDCVPRCGSPVVGNIAVRKGTLVTRTVVSWLLNHHDCDGSSYISDRRRVGRGGGAVWCF